MAINPVAILATAVLGTFLLAGLCLCYAIAADANARGANGSVWGLVAFAVPPIAVPVYLLHRRELPRRTDSPGRFERIAGSIGIGVVAAVVVVGGIVSPPDPFSVVLYAGPLIVVCVPLAFVCCYEPGWRALVD
ncbi:hypothetical protein [Halopiger xanaduensis]|uniref:Uncharacterized protein n=1 Tax=Halopiger xanaduensis (strain DSM 18323 / JCM 14033 / SH-6) TaxID=797210 RepID=F8D3L0_HALXS|nr:hypothetical protein [Halopiger xanaduensis]AEH37375.1 hypothetical protein Halxa_2759 [Halopiger xanaduensis SH-6]